MTILTVNLQQLQQISLSNCFVLAGFSVPRRRHKSRCQQPVGHIFRDLFELGRGKHISVYDMISRLYGYTLYVRNVMQFNAMVWYAGIYYVSFQVVYSSKKLVAASQKKHDVGAWTAQTVFACSQAFFRVPGSCVLFAAQSLLPTPILLANPGPAPFSEPETRLLRSAMA